MSAISPDALRGLPYVSARRRNTDRAMRGLLALATAIALLPLVLIFYYLLHKGLRSWSASFFTTDPNGNFFGSPGGIRSAIVGSLEIVGLATAIAIPVGIGVALYLTEYGGRRGVGTRGRRLPLGAAGFPPGMVRAVLHLAAAVRALPSRLL